MIHFTKDDRINVLITKNFVYIDRQMCVLIFVYRRTLPRAQQVDQSEIPLQRKARLILQQQTMKLRRSKTLSHSSIQQGA